MLCVLKDGVTLFERNIELDYGANINYIGNVFVSWNGKYIGVTQYDGNLDGKDWFMLYEGS